MGRIKKLILAIVLCLTLTLYGCANNINSIDGIFSQADLTANIDEINICKEVDHVNVNLKKAFYDGVSLYIQLIIKGYDIKTSKPTQFENITESSLCFFVDSFYISDEKGIVIDGFNSINDTYEKYNYLSNYNAGHDENYLLLPFENIDIDNSLSYKLNLHLNGMKEDIVFENLKFSNNDFKEVDIDENNGFDILNAECLVTKIIYTKARTIIDVQWKISDMKKFNEEYLNNYSKNYQVYFSSGDVEEFFYLDPLISPYFDNTLSEERTIDCRYTFNIVSDIDDIICIKEYNKVSGESKGVPTKTIFSFNSK